MRNGWTYLQHFDTGIIAATGRRASLKHVLAQLQHQPETNTLLCEADGVPGRSAARKLRADNEFTVRIKCADKKAKLYLTARGKAVVVETGRNPAGICLKLRVHITGIAAYRKQKDEAGNPVLKPLYNDMSVAEDSRAQAIEGYRG